MYVTEPDVFLAGLYPHSKEFLKHYPESLHPYCGKGYGIWQYPNQFAKYLNMVMQYDIDTYLEIGTAAGGTFMFTADKLRKFKGTKKFYAIDIAPLGTTNYLVNKNIPSPFKNSFKKYLIEHSDCSFYQSDITRFLNNNKVDSLGLVLIDGDHSYNGCKKDYEAVKDISNIIAFHDITNDDCPGVRVFWNEIKLNPNYEAYEFTEQYFTDKSFLGMGVLVKK